MQRGVSEQEVVALTGEGKETAAQRKGDSGFRLTGGFFAAAVADVWLEAQGRYCRQASSPSWGSSQVKARRGSRKLSDSGEISGRLMDRVKVGVSCARMDECFRRIIAYQRRKEEVRLQMRIKRAIELDSGRETRQERESMMKEVSSRVQNHF